MNILDIPNMRRALREWNSARESEFTASNALDEARKTHLAARVRLAEVHKKIVDVAGLENEHLFPWTPELYGDREQLLELATMQPNTKLSRAGMRPNETAEL